MNREFRLLIGVAAIALGACHRTRDPATTPEPEVTLSTTVRVENDAFLDMNIYVYRGSQPYRLGTVTGHSSTVFVIPKTIIYATTPLRFRADPIGGQRLPFTEEITVSPGDQIGLRIPPS